MAAEATERAAQANLELANLLERLAPRRLSAEQVNALQSLRGKVEAINVACTSGFEPFHFAADIGEALRLVGIKTAVFSRPPTVFSVGVQLYDQQAFMPDWTNLNGEQSGGEPIKSAMRAAGLFMFDSPIVHCIPPEDIAAPKTSQSSWLERNRRFRFLAHPMESEGFLCR
jgi:hypothetical protein